MAFLYGDGVPTRNPAWVTGNETPSQRDRRLRDINDVLKKQERREQERRNRELFTQIERQTEIRFNSPPSPPRGIENPLDLDENIQGFLGAQDNFEGFLDKRLDEYEDRFGQSPSFGFGGYNSAELSALDDWRKSQPFTPDDLISEREDGLLERSRAFRLEAYGLRGRPETDRVVDSRYDILVDTIKADTGAPEAVDAWLVGLEKDIRKDIGKDADPETVREQLYRTLSIQEHLSDVLDEQGWPRDMENPPDTAIEEALRREGEQNGRFFQELPDKPGFIERISGVFKKEIISTKALEAILGPGTRKFFGIEDKDFISLDDVHRGAQVIADPVSGLILRGDIPIPKTTPSGALEFDTVETGTGLAGAARAAEFAVEAHTFGQIKTTAVSDALRSQLAEDILSEAISPDYMAIAFPFAGVGVAARGTQITKILQITSNLIGAGGLEVSGPRALARLARFGATTSASNVRGILVGLTKVARNPAALSNIPKVVRQSPLFQQGLENLRAARAWASRQVLSPEEYLSRIGADDPVRFRRVLRDLVQDNPAIPENIPLREAIRSDLSAGRSVPDVIENGLSTPAKVGPRVTGEGGEVASFWRGEQSGGLLGRLFRNKTEITEANLFKALDAGEPVSHAGLQRVVRDTGLIDPDLIGRASEIELIELIQARRISTSLGSRRPVQLKKDELVDLLKEASLPVAEKPERNPMLKQINTSIKKGDSVAASIESRLWEELTDTDVADLMRALAEGKLNPGVTPTQLISGRDAPGLKRLHFQAFDTSRSLPARTKSVEAYIRGVEKLAAKSREGSVARGVLEADAKVERWAFEAEFGIKPFADVQEGLLDTLVILTKEHRGTPEERLAGLATARADEINNEIATFLDRFPKLKKTQRDRLGHRILIQALDIETGVEIYDAGRQLEVLLKVVGVDQKLKDDAYRGLQVLTTSGTTPTSAQIGAMRKVLDPVLGKGATSELLNARKFTVKSGELLVNSIGLPRALMASADISAVGRQGAIIGARMPVQWTKMVFRSIRAFWQPEYADEVRKSIINSGIIRLENGEIVDVYQYLTKDAGLFLASDAGQLGLTFKEEEWMTHFASKWGWHLPRDKKGRLSAKLWDLEKIPFPVPLANSERAYVVGLDKIRMDFATNEMRKMIQRGMANGRPATLKDFQDLALFTNNATGRGKMGDFLRRNSPLLNALFFAPRLVISRFAILGDVARFTVKGGPMRRVVWETLAADAATLAGAMFLMETGLKTAGFDVSINYLNPVKKGSDGVWRVESDFMKVKVGDTRIDFLASMGPVQRLLLGLGVAAVQGDGEMAARHAEFFGRSKVGPVPGATLDVVTGKDFIGGKIELTVDDLVLDIVASRTIPLSWQGPVEAIAASRGEFDVDTGAAVIDLAENKPNKEEVGLAGVALSAEMIGGGVVSFFNPGEKLREADEENLQDLLGNGSITPTQGQVINAPEDLDSIQQIELEESRNSEEKILEQQAEEQGLWRDSEWANNQKDEREFHEQLRLDGTYTNPDTGQRVKLWDQTMKELAENLRIHQIDGGQYQAEVGENIGKEIDIRRALFGFEGEDVEDIENPVDKLLAEYWEIELEIIGGERDFDTFQEKRDAKKAEISRLVGSIEAVEGYFASFRREDETQLDLRVAREQRDAIEELPLYMGGVTAAAVVGLQRDIENYLRSVGSRWGTARYIQWLYYQDEKYQTKEMAVAYWVASRESDQVLNPQRTEIILNNPDLVLFFPGLFRELPDDGKQSFINLPEGLDALSKKLKEEFIDSGELAPPQSETQLFRPSPIGTPLFAR